MLTLFTLGLLQCAVLTVCQHQVDGVCFNHIKPLALIPACCGLHHIRNIDFLYCWIHSLKVLR